mmetsp:Transcript_8672/g.17600  ORF Transcript_8672/g.17600 Transcript_8672/m.17600 type:complete len:95 (-) Transcript_8672:528-812(-)
MRAFSQAEVFVDSVGVGVGEGDPVAPELGEGADEGKGEVVGVADGVGFAVAFVQSLSVASVKFPINPLGYTSLSPWSVQFFTCVSKQAVLLLLA